MYVYDNDYTVVELAKLALSTLRTKLFYTNATLIRHPIYLRGVKRISFGKGFTTGYNCRIETFGKKDDREKKIIFGENCHLGDYVHIAALEKVVIGENCLMASRIFISDLDHGYYSGDVQSPPYSDPNNRELTSSPVVIGDNVWIGEGVCILKGVTVGSGSIIGSNAVVTKDIPENSIAVGIPARVVKEFSDEENRWIGK